MGCLGSTAGLEGFGGGSSQLWGSQEVPLASARLMESHSPEEEEEEDEEEEKEEEKEEEEEEKKKEEE